MEGRLPDPMGNMKQMLQHCAKARGAIRDILGQVSRPPSSSIPAAGLPP